jgi:hypothetical protein
MCRRRFALTILTHKLLNNIVIDIARNVHQTTVCLIEHIIRHTAYACQIRVCALCVAIFWKRLSPTHKAVVVHARWPAF